MSARNRFRDWYRRLFRRHERPEIDYDARHEFEERVANIAARLDWLGLSADVKVDRHRPNAADRMQR